MSEFPSRVGRLISLVIAGLSAICGVVVATLGIVFIWHDTFVDRHFGRAIGAVMISVGALMILIVWRLARGKSAYTGLTLGWAVATLAVTFGFVVPLARGVRVDPLQQLAYVGSMGGIMLGLYFLVRRGSRERDA